MFLAKDKLVNVCKNNIRAMFIIFLVCGFTCILCFVNLHELICKFPAYATVRLNLDFLAAVGSKYGRLFLTLGLLLLFIHFKCNYKINVTDFTFAGFSFALKDPERIIRVKIRNYLNTKRSLFYYYEGYDNLYDVMDSWYKILLYVREQLCFLEDSKPLSKNAFYNSLLDLTVELNSFLTKYQSDYRRWYKYQLQCETYKADEFRMLYFIQREYFKYSEIMMDIKLLNEKMREKSNIWSIDCKVWEKIR